MDPKDVWEWNAFRASWRYLKWNIGKIPGDVFKYLEDR